MAFGTETLQWAIIFTCKYLKLNKVEADPFFSTEIGTSFKSKRDAKKKSLSSQDHNWNTLFLGMNAVADVMADKYNTTKGGILDGASSSSLAVRMALGETQVVTETRKFLVSQGVKLDVFGQVCFSRTFSNAFSPVAA